MPAVFIEFFFAVLPLIVLGANWPDKARGHPEAFSSSPEWPMTACILYGLTLVRLTAAYRHRRATKANHLYERLNLLLLFPLLGVIVSVIIIGKLSTANPGTFAVVTSYANLAASVIVFLVLGGYGLRQTTS